VQNVVLVPSFGFSLACVEKRKPLSQSARRAGWIGCNILLSGIPSDFRISLVQNGIAVKKDEARRRYSALTEMQSLRVSSRGWLIDVWNAARSLRKVQFTLDEIYEKESDLSYLHPENHNIRPKIRQQLQIMRDMGVLKFMGGGIYQWREEDERA
jgi:type II restriction enzyme